MADRPDEHSGVSHAAYGNGSTKAATVRNVVQSRSRRAKFFRASLFADPAWDILLLVYSAQLEQQRVAVSEICTSVGVPETTMIRWVTILEAEGLIARTVDNLNGGQSFVSLTDAGFCAIDSFFETLPQNVSTA